MPSIPSLSTSQLVTASTHTVLLLAWLHRVIIIITGALAASVEVGDYQMQPYIQAVCQGDVPSRRTFSASVYIHILGSHSEEVILRKHLGWCRNAEQSVQPAPLLADLSPL